MARALLVVPAALRNHVYDYVAQHRSACFGKTAFCQVGYPGIVPHEANDSPEGPLTVDDLSSMSGSNIRVHLNVE